MMSRALRLPRRMVVVALLLGGLLASLQATAEAFHVEGTSMVPALHSGQALLVDRAAYWRLEGRFVFGGPRRGDLVVFRPPSAVEHTYVKRVIGLPGETVLVRTGQVLVNGQPLDEPYGVVFDDYTYPADGRPLPVPEGAYFVLGDNRPASADSHQGWFLPAENVVGQAWPLPW